MLGKSFPALTLFLNQEQNQRKTKSIFLGLVLKGDGGVLGPEWYGLE